MSGGKIVVLASKEPPGTQSTLGTSQSVLLIQNDATALREDLIVEKDSEESSSSAIKRKILLVEKCERQIDSLNAEQTSSFPIFPKYNGGAIIDHKDLSSVNILCESVNKRSLHLKPIEKLKDQEGSSSSQIFPRNEFEIQGPKFEEDFDSFDNVEIMEKLQSLTEVNVKEENFMNDYKDMEFCSESELMDPLQNQSFDLPPSTSFSPNNHQTSGVLVYLEPENSFIPKVSSQATTHVKSRYFKRPYQKDKFSGITQQPKVPCRFCKGTYKATFLSEHIRKQHLSTSKGYQMIKCDKCEKSFKSAENLRNHMVRSHLTCSICAKNCKTFEDLDKHHQESHSCSICKKLFISKEKIEKHKEDVHNICQVCSSEFTSLAQLSSHIQKNHPRCAICGLIFKNQELFDKHEKEHYECWDCGVLFRSIEDKRKHFSMHHACVYCSKVFEKILNLNAHKAAHRTCPICRLQFKSVQEQINHQNINHFKCHVCSITFRRMEDYTQHQRLDHQINTPKRKHVKETKRIILLESKDD